MRMNSLFRFWGVLLIAVLASCMRLDQAPLSDAKKASAVQARLAAGFEALKNELPDRARRHFERAIDIDPKAPEAYNAMALLSKYELDPEKEEAYYKKALRHNSRYSPANNNYGVLLVAQGKYAKANKYFKRAIEDSRYSKRSEALRNLGKSYLLQGEFEQAELSLNRSLALNSRSADAVLLMAQVNYRKQQYKLAERYHEQYANMLETQSAQGFFWGIRIAQKRQNKDAIDSMMFALERLYPDSAELQVLKNAENAPSELSE